MTLKDEITRYYDAVSLDYDRSAGYTNLEAEEQRESIKERFRGIVREKMSWKLHAAPDTGRR